MTRDPLVLLAGLAAVSAGWFALHLAGMPLHPAQQLTAAACLLLWLAAVAGGPAGGLVLLYLLPPLFNGEDGRPYFFLLEVLVYLTILAGVATRAWRRWPPAGPGGVLALLLLLSAVLSFPLNVAELRLAFTVASWGEILEDLRRSELAGQFFYFRTLLNVASGLALYALAAGERWSRETFVRLATATTLVYLAVSLLGLWHYWVPVTPGKFMTVAYGWTFLQGQFLGLGFNQSYFAQYALAYLPLSALLLVERAAWWARGAALLALGLTPYTILSTGQKQRVQLARALIHRLPVLLLDEPTLGLDVLGTQTVVEYISLLRGEGKAVIITTHQLDEAERLCDRFGLMHHGRLVSEGTLAELRTATGCGNLFEMFLKLAHVGPRLTATEAEEA